MTPSRFLGPLAWAGLLRVGDVLVPGDGELPSFSRSGCAVHVDRMLPYMHDDDRAGVSLLLGVFRFCPRFLLRRLFALTDRHRQVPNPVGTVLRLINLGIKGTVMTLYYSDLGEGPSIRAALGWQARIVVTEPPPAGEKE